MDLRSAIERFVEQGRDLIAQLRSPEGDQLILVDLHLVEIELYLFAKK